MELKDSYREILHRLEKDSRSKRTDIGEETGNSQQTVSYAIKSMKDRGVIRGYHTLFDYTKFGYNGYMVLFRVNAFSRERMEELIDLFLDHEMVGTVERLYGGWDLKVFFLAPNTSKFNKKFKSLVSQHPDQLRNYSILTSVVIHEMGRDYLNRDAERAEDLIIGGDRELVDVDDSLKDVCRELWKDPSRTSSEMAEELGVTPKTVIDRIERLKEKKLVKGFRPRIGIEELGVRTHLLLIKYNNRDVALENELRDDCVEHPNVTNLTKTYGSYDVVVRIETEEEEGHREVVNSIREEYQEIIQDYDLLQVADQVEKRYLPPSYFAQK